MKKKNMKRRLLLVLALVALAAPALPARAVDEELYILNPAWDPELFPVPDRAVNLLTAETMRPKTLLVVVAHRGYQSFDEEAWDSFLGLDSGQLKIELGLRYGLIENLDLGLTRNNDTIEVFDTYEFDARYRLLTQDRHFVDLALRPGLSWFSQPDEDDAAGGFVQLLASRHFGLHFQVGAGLLYHSDSTSDVKSTVDPKHSAAVAGLIEWRITPKVAWDLELAQNLRTDSDRHDSIGGYGEPRPAIATGLKYTTYRHSFALLLSNTQYALADGMVTGAWRDWDNLVFGFTLTREVKL